MGGSRDGTLSCKSFLNGVFFVVLFPRPPLLNTALPCLFENSDILDLSSMFILELTGSMSMSVLMLLV